LGAGGRRVGPGRKGGRKCTGGRKRGDGGRDSLRRREAGEIGKNYAILCNICNLKEARVSQKGEGTRIKGHGKQDVCTLSVRLPCPRPPQESQERMEDTGLLYLMVFILRPTLLRSIP